MPFLILKSCHQLQRVIFEILVASAQSAQRFIHIKNEDGKNIFQLTFFTVGLVLKQKVFEKKKALSGPCLISNICVLWEATINRPMGFSLYLKELMLTYAVSIII